jgi:membrane-bound serine protease (ClpP class)
MKTSESTLFNHRIMERVHRPGSNARAISRSCFWLAIVATVFFGSRLESVTFAQDAAVEESKTGVLIDVPLPLTSRGVTTVTQSLESISDSGDNAAAKATRTTVVLRYLTAASDGEASQFEEALRLARAMARPELRQLRLVSFVEGELKGHALLPVMASDLLVVTDAAVLREPSIAEPSGTADDTVLATYQAIAARRGLFPPSVVATLLRPGQELVLATTLDGKRRFASGDELVALRRDGGGWQEEVWAAQGQTLQLTADRLRSSRIANQVVRSFDELANALDLAELKTLSSDVIEGQATAGLLEVKGAISKDRVRRWELNLAKATDAGELNTVVVTLDSSGGDLESSLRFAGTLSSTVPPLQRSIGYIQNQALADAALVAVACKPLHLHPDAKLGGAGGQAMNESDIQPIQEALEQIAADAGRSPALIRGLLDPELKVYRYTHTKTGQLRYATEDEFALGSDEPEEERKLWRRGEKIELAQGIDAARAIELGLAEGQSATMQDLVTAVGLDQVPVPIVDRGLVHFVEWIGGMKGVSVLLLMIGMVALSMEAGAPGISVPGFVALLAFSAYFWIQFLNGTAQWLEIMLFALGLMCIAIELFLLPGVGVFGIGGLVLLVLGVILTSQTFVIPRNTYQFEQLTRSLWLVVGGFGAIIVGFAMLRILMPQRTILKHLALEMPDDEAIDRAERLSDYEYLLGESGVATTPLRPAGKARFGSEFVQVVSDGSPVNTGDAVRVIEVRGNRIVVSPMES